MATAMRWGGDPSDFSLTVSIMTYPSADLSTRESGGAEGCFIKAGLKRSTRHNREPRHGARRISLYTGNQIDPSLHEAAVRDAPSLQPRRGSAKFAWQARLGDVLVHIAGVVPHKEAARGDRGNIVATPDDLGGGQTLVW